MLTALVLLALAQPVEVVPGLITTAHLEIDDAIIRSGMPAAQAAAALGAKLPKAHRYRLDQLQSEMTLIENLAPSAGIDGRPLAELVADHCGSECHQAMIRHRLDKDTEVRVALFGPTPDAMAVAFILVDRGRAVINRWYAREQAESNARYSRYFLTPSGGYRVFRQDRTVRFEKVR